MSYEFSQQWFNSNIPIWDCILVNYKEKRLNVLEIGSHEGVSTTWIINNLLQYNQDSRITCIDPFLSDDTTSPVNEMTYHRFLNNVKATGQEQKVILHKDKSKSVLPLLLLARKKFDIIYIDGSHLPADIMFDATICSELLNEEGMLIFDDYNSITNDFEIKKTINAFIDTLNPKEWRIAYSNYQMFLQKDFRESRTDIWDLDY